MFCKFIVNRLQLTTPTTKLSIRDAEVFSSPSPFRASTKVQPVYNGHAHAQVIFRFESPIFFSAIPYITPNITPNTTPNITPIMYF